MKKLIMIAALCFLGTAVAHSQDDEKTALAETMYLLPKAGMNKQFEAGVAAHNKKFHPEGKENAAMLRRVEYGSKAGWYVWVMKGSYASLDNRANDDAHNEDWEGNVGKYVEEYGMTDLWSFNKNLSVGVDIFKNQKRYQTWAVYLKPWQGYRFNDIMSKMKETYEKMGDVSMIIYNTQVARKDGPDVGMVWGYENFAELEEDSNLVENYEELHGEGSWRLFLEEWKGVVEDIDQEHRVKVGM